VDAGRVTPVSQYPSDMKKNKLVVFNDTIGGLSAPAGVAGLQGSPLDRESSLLPPYSGLICFIVGLFWGRHSRALRVAASMS
jgi:hypothetical protein